MPAFLFKNIAAIWITFNMPMNRQVRFHMSWYPVIQTSVGRLHASLHGKPVQLVTTLALGSIQPCWNYYTKSMDILPD